jgi:hypothetical protein
MPRPIATVVAAILAVEEGEEGVVEGVFEAVVDVVGVVARAGLDSDDWFEEADVGFGYGVFDDGLLEGCGKSGVALAFEIGLDGDADELLLVGEGALDGDDSWLGLEDEDGSDVRKRASEEFGLEFEGGRGGLTQEYGVSASARCLRPAARVRSDGQDGGRRSTYQKN